MNTQDTYADRRIHCLEPLAKRLETFLSECLKGTERIDRISARAKAVDRFVQKAGKTDDEGIAKYDDPLNQIQDQVGARIICFYLSDVERIERSILDFFRPIENRLIVPDSQSKFGYFGKHLILIFPDDVIDDDNKPNPNVFELQIKTLFQHAWSEAEHDVTYKPQKNIARDIERKVAFTAAQAWGADHIFNELLDNIAANDPGTDLHD